MVWKRAPSASGTPPNTVADQIQPISTFVDVVAIEEPTSRSWDVVAIATSATTLYR
jgi:hypothetical protein